MLQYVAQYFSILTLLHTIPHILDIDLILRIIWFWDAFRKYLMNEKSLSNWTRLFLVMNEWCPTSYNSSNITVSFCNIKIFISHVLIGIDTRIRFSLEPLPGDSAFDQWRDAMKAVARLPHGIPDSFRKKVCTSTLSLKFINKCLNLEQLFWMYK